MLVNQYLYLYITSDMFWSSDKELNTIPMDTFIINPTDMWLLPCNC